MGDDGMSDIILSLNDIQKKVKPLAEKYHISEVYLFGSYARSEATVNSDLDFLVFGGEHFKLTAIFAFAEELRLAINKKVDVFEIHEVNEDSLWLFAVCSGFPESAFKATATLDRT